jgi:hypothetical protein
MAKLTNAAVSSLGLLFLLLLGTPKDGPAQTKMRMVKVAEDVYMMQHPQGSSNSTFVVTPGGVLVFDTDIRTADQTLAAIRSLTDKKVRYIITSH